MFDLVADLDELFLKLAANNIDGAMGEEELAHVYDWVYLGGSGGKYSVLFNIINAVLKIMEPLGYALITIFFLMYLFDAAAKDNVTVDSLIKVMIQLVLAIALIKNIDTIVNAMLGLSDGLVNSLKSGIVGSTKFSWKDNAEVLTKGTGYTASALSGAEIVEQWHDQGEDLTGTIFMQSIFMLLLHKIATIGVIFAIVQRNIEVGWRIALAPVGLSNCFEGGMNSNGIRYLKTLFVCILSSVAIYLTVALGYAVSAGFLSAAEGGGLLAAQVAQLGTAGAAIGVSNKVRDLA